MDLDWRRGKQWSYCQISKWATWCNNLRSQPTSAWRGKGLVNWVFNGGG